MTDTFTASNGIQITMDTDRDGKVYLVGRRARGDEGQYLDTHATAGPGGIVALREFFQHERDEERGLWRSPTDPSWTAVRRNTTIYFQNEDHERNFWFIVGNDATLKPWSGDLQAVAREYLEAHPERKPWEDAKPGEAWEITYTTLVGPDVTKVAIRTDRNMWATDVLEMELNHAITSARRIWPEDAS